MLLPEHLSAPSSYLLVVLHLITAVTAVLSAGGMPNSVAESEEGIRAIWRAAREGTITNVLPREFQHLQAPWEEFLSGRGTTVVMDFYSQAEDPRWKRARRFGYSRFLALTQLTKRQPYSFNPSRWPMKQSLATLLAESFAEQQVAIKKAEEQAAPKGVGVGEAGDKEVRTLNLLSFASKDKAVGGGDLVGGARTAQPAHQRHNWGSTLSLGRDRGTGDVPQDPSHAPSTVLDHDWAHV